MSNPYPDSMFETLGYSNPVGPTPEELKQQMEEAQRISKVNFIKYVARTYDLRKLEDVKRYESDMHTLVNGVAKRTHTIFNRDKQFIQASATWMVSIEWGEFELVVEELRNAPSPTATVDVPFINRPLTDEQKAEQRLETYGKAITTRDA